MLVKLREFGAQGIHVAHIIIIIIIIDGQIDIPKLRAMTPERDKKTLLAPEANAQTYWQLHQQDETAWKRGDRFTT